MFDLEDDAGRSVVLEIEKPLRPASQRLMDALGVQVRIVTAVETPIKSTCNVAGCGWWVEGPPDYVRDLAREHREERHPEIAKFERRQMAAARASREALAHGAPVIEPESPVIEPDTPAEEPPATPEPEPPPAPVITPSTGRASRVTREECVAAIYAKVAELGRSVTIGEWQRLKWSPSHETIRQRIGGAVEFRKVVDAALLGSSASDFSTSSEVEKQEEPNELELIRQLNAEELIVVGSVLQAVGRVRALENRERALPLITRLVGDLHREVTPA